MLTVQWVPSHGPCVSEGMQARHACMPPCSCNTAAFVAAYVSKGRQAATHRYHACTVISA